MSGLELGEASNDLAALILSGISALGNPGTITSYINSSTAENNSPSSVQPKTNYITCIQNRTLSKKTEPCRFKTLLPAAVAASTPGIITYDLLNEQLFMYFSRFISTDLTEYSKNKAEEQVQEFINICLDPSNRENLVRLRSLIKAIDSICLENYRKKAAFKLFLDSHGLLGLGGLLKFNIYARRLGLRMQAWSSNHYDMTDMMLQAMLEIIDLKHAKPSKDIIDYVKHLEKFILMPISEAIKPTVDPRARSRIGIPFYGAFYEIINHQLLLSSEQNFFMIPPKEGRILGSAVRLVV